MSARAWIRRWLPLLLLWLVALAAPVHAYTIETIAGTGVGDYGGDGGLATDAQLNIPQDVVVDGSNNIYIADTSNHRVRKIDASTGVINTIAGTGVQGFLGDGGLATAAYLNTPSGISIDGANNIYIADAENHRVRRIDAATGLISTIAGTGVAGFSGDAGLATAARLNWPTGLYVDGSGNVYIADYGNRRVRKIDGSTGVISTIAGTGVAGFSGDGGLATAAQLRSPRRVSGDGSNNVYIVDLVDQRVRKIDGSTGVISTIAGTGVAGFSGDGGLATAAQLNFPHGIFIDGSNNVYIADISNQRVRKVDGTTGNISTIAGTGIAGFSGDGGPATEAQLNDPYGIYGDGSSNVYVVDSLNSRVRRLNAPAAGACGTANDVATAFLPTSNLCSVGSASAVSATEPWAWTCSGTGGGSTVNCSAPHDTVPGGSGSGTGTASVTGNTWVVDEANSSGFIETSGDPKSPPNLPAGYSFPHGLFDFVLIEGTPGSAATITITYPTVIPDNAVYWKYGPSPDGFNCSGAACLAPHWYQMPASQAVFSGNQVTLTIYDGGVGDDDLNATNGVIVDQGGPGVPVGAATAIPTLSEWAMIILTSLMALSAVITLRRRYR